MTATPAHLTLDLKNAKLSSADLSNVGEQKAFKQLQKNQQSASKVRWRVSGTIFVAASIACTVAVIGWVPYAFAGRKVIPGGAVVHIPLQCLSMCMFLQAVLLTDARLIRIISDALVGGMFFMCALWVLLVLAFLGVGMRNSPVVYERAYASNTSVISEEHLRAVFLKADMTQGGSCVGFIIFIGVPVIYYFFTRILKRAAGAPSEIKVVQERYGNIVGAIAYPFLRLLPGPVPCMLERAGYYAVPPSTALTRMWIALRSLLVVGSVIFLVSGVVNDSVAHELKDLGADPAAIGFWGAESLIIAYCIAIIAGPLTAPVWRAFVHSTLLGLGTRSETKAAASVAVLLGGFKPLEALALARAKFRAIALDQLKTSDFMSNEDTKAFELSMPCKLGECDGFVSHSWKDPGARKLEVLGEWGKSVRAARHKEPLVWLDKACISQESASSIKQNLAMLPIFLAGCNELIVLAGPTYTSRVWCVMEMYVFLKMGGSLRRARVMPLDDLEQDQVYAMFETFDVKKASCYVDEEREFLLGVIRTGFGNLGGFNALIRATFTSQLGSTPGRTPGRMSTGRSSVSSSSGEGFGLQVV